MTEVISTHQLCRVSLRRQRRAFAKARPWCSTVTYHDVADETMSKFPTTSEVARCGTEQLGGEWVSKSPLVCRAAICGSGSMLTSDNPPRDSNRRMLRLQQADGGTDACLCRRCVCWPTTICRPFCAPEVPRTLGLKHNQADPLWHPPACVARPRGCRRCECLRVRQIMPIGGSTTP